MLFSPIPSPRLIRLVICALLVIGVCAEPNNETSPTHSFKSRPDLHAPIANITVLKPELVTPGYIFLGPYRNVDPGPYIYDNYGQLVWSGAGDSGPKTAHSPRVCTYKGIDHLCYFEGKQHQGFARGHGVIMDSNYRIVKTVESYGAATSADMHEFKMTPYSNSTTALMTVYQPRRYDFTTNPAFNLRHGMGWIVEGIFQEIEIETGDLVFEWRSLDHIDPSEAWTKAGTTDTSGDGLRESSPWDYFHLNSIDKNPNGDYLISARHVSAIYKVSGVDGSIVWQLGGNHPSFNQTNFLFSYQHHARWISENSTHTLLSLFDNAANGYNATGNSSTAYIVSINHIANTATRLQTWGMPSPGLRSTSQASFQRLPNGGAHIGWGENAQYSEHTADGEVVLHAKLADRASNVMIYRSHKFNWTATPLTKPALYAFSRDGPPNSTTTSQRQIANTAFWCSWNGATEVASWTLYVGESASGPWREIGGNVTKTGFETEFWTSQFTAWSFVEARDKEGRALERSEVVKTFVPSEGLRRFCDRRDCGVAEAVKKEEQGLVVVDEVGLFGMGGSAGRGRDRKMEKSNERGFDTKKYYVEMERVEEKEDEEESGDHDVEYAQETWIVRGGFFVGVLCALAGIAVWKAGGWKRAVRRGSAVVVVDLPRWWEDRKSAGGSSYSSPVMKVEDHGGGWEEKVMILEDLTY